MNTSNDKLKAADSKARCFTVMQAVPEQQPDLILLPDFSKTDQTPRNATEVIEYFESLYQAAASKGINLVAVPWGWIQDAARELKAKADALSTPQPAVTVSVDELAKIIEKATYNTDEPNFWSNRAAVAVFSRLNITPTDATPTATKEPGKTMGQLLFERRWGGNNWHEASDSVQQIMEADASAVIAAFLDSISEIQIASLPGPFDTNDARRILNYLKQRATAHKSKC